MMRIDQREFVPARAHRWDNRGGAKAQRAGAGVDIGHARRLNVTKLERYGAPIHRQRERLEHPARIGERFPQRDDSVAVAIDPRRHLSRDADPSREIDLEAYALTLDTNPRRLQIFVKPVRTQGGWGQYGDDDREQRSVFHCAANRQQRTANREQRTANSEPRISALPTAPRNRSSDPDRWCGCDPGPPAAARTR